MKTKFEKVFLSLLCFLVASLILSSGCANTITHDDVKTKVVGFSGNNTNGGWVGFAEDGQGIITSGKRAEYNALIKIYGKKFIPPIDEDFGITPYTNQTFLIHLEGLSDFLLMKQWQKDNPR